MQCRLKWQVCTRSPINLTWLKTVVLSTYIHVIWFLCAWTIKHWHATALPHTIFETHNVSTHREQDVHSAYNTPTDRHNIKAMSRSLYTTLTMKSSCTTMKETCRQRLYATMIDRLCTWENTYTIRVNISNVRNKTQGPHLFSWLARERNLLSDVYKWK